MNISRLINLFTEARECWILWLPVFFGIGIIINLSLLNEPSIFFAIPLLILLLLTIWFIKSETYFIIILPVILGFIITSIRIDYVEAPRLKYNIDYAQIEGELISITPTIHGSKIIIEDPKIKNNEQLKLKRIRLNIRTKLLNVKIGDVIKIKASLSPPPKSVILQGYNFSFTAYFEQIGAIGYGLSNAYVVTAEKSSYLANLRRNMTISIIEILGKEKGYIATALMVGEYNAIDKKILENMRISGISHILSVSGMHLSLAATIFFFFTRLFLNLIPYAANYWNIKKIASIIAILGSLGYLLISGLQIAAIRSFIMTFLIIFAILIDRIPTPIRSVMAAFLFILIWQPESIVNPSFQMSFAAVITLIASYEFYTKFSPTAKFTSNIFNKILFYIVSTFISSIIAGLATTPFAMYHFNGWSGYGVISNLIAVPVTSFLIMPCVIIAFIFYPLKFTSHTIICDGLWYRSAN